ncbi:MAG: ATP-binding protein [Woeseiaceae bacterium]|nr:ATP-binding protein [Woeseiaceae bacterium]
MPSHRIGVIRAVIVGLVLSVGTIALWANLVESNEQQVARIAEAESYAARSQLIRNFDTLLAALRGVRIYWYAFGHLPEDQWASDAGVELEHFEGIRMILWDDPQRGIRYVRTDENPTFNYRPGDEEWASYQELLERARSAENDVVLGPFRNNGRYELEIVVTGRADDRTGKLAAIVDIDRMLDAFLVDESPGFAIRIFDGDVEIYARGEPARDSPESWIREGRIRSSFDTLWLVRHLPTRDMLRSFSTPGVDLTLLLGLIVAVLMGSLIFENHRARSRAVAAEIAEAKVNEMNRSLEDVVERRTRMLAERTSDLQTLADSVAHDLRNPLNTLSVNIELLEDSLEETADDDVRTTIGRLSPCIDQMTGVLDRLLGMTTVAYSTFERVPLNMNELVEEIGEDLRASDSGPPIELVVADLPQAMADRTLTEILLINLLGNALKYTRNKPRREISVDADIEDGVTVYRVSDNGVGFDEKQAERIFEAFTRLDDADTSEGIGLGLSLARKVIARHKGRIWAESSPGEGAMFCFTLEPPSA